MPLALFLKHLCAPGIQLSLRSPHQAVQWQSAWPCGADLAACAPGLAAQLYSVHEGCSQGCCNPFSLLCSRDYFSNPSGPGHSLALMRAQGSV